MEDKQETSTANLVGIKGFEEIKNNSKTDSLSINANTLSVYILTIVSDLEDEDITENSKTITLDAGASGNRNLQHV